jgi:formyltetrahydrofolate synthetase
VNIKNSLRLVFRRSSDEWKHTSRGVKVMAKVNKAYSLDMETINMVEVYTHRGETSRSALVNEAIKWYIRGDFAELMDNHKQLKQKYDSLCNEVYGAKLPSTPWWKRLLGLN